MWFVCVCVSSVSGLHVCMCVYAWLSVMSSPVSWESLQVSWEPGCFCLWFDPGTGLLSLRTYPPRSPRKHLCVSSSPGPSVESLQGVELLLLFLCMLGEAVPGTNFTQ